MKGGEGGRRMLMFNLRRARPARQPRRTLRQAATDAPAVPGAHSPHLPFWDVGVVISTEVHPSIVIVARECIQRGLSISSARAMLEHTPYTVSFHSWWLRNTLIRGCDVKFGRRMQPLVG